VAAARYVGDTETAEVCAGILKEEIAMAEWLDHNSDALVRLFLERANNPGEQAKR